MLKYSHGCGNKLHLPQGAWGVSSVHGVCLPCVFCVIWMQCIVTYASFWFGVVSLCCFHSQGNNTANDTEPKTHLNGHKMRLNYTKDTRATPR